MEFFTLLVPTINRTKELERLLNSVKETNYKNIEIIIVDQNDNSNVLDGIINNFPLLKIIHIKSDRKGLSLNRNLGIKNSSYKWVTLSDDDAIYDKNYFELLSSEIEKNKEIDIWVSNVRNIEDSNFYTLAPKFRNKNFRLRNFKQICSISLTIRRDLFEEIGLFDEDFGVGSIYGACEESDWILRAYSYKAKLKLAERCNVYHPKFIKNYNNLNRIKNYSIGFGAFYRKQIQVFKFYEKCYFFFDFSLLLIRSFVGIFINIFSYKRNYYIKSFSYKILGFIKYR